ncbi:ATP/GTP-binding protein [Streptomyces sp. NPDC048419]|uniref:ATP/GTP-binding protein n=1 Tax=Streptomyces sp. NPDC048419 TaxID=3365547 RepID=UPI00371E770F
MVAGWARAESTVTKVFLAAVFAVGLVAQFVKPVGDALQDKVYLGGALLTVVGYVLYAEVQRLNAAHAERRESEEALGLTVQRLDRQVEDLKGMLRLRAGQMVKPTELKDEFKRALESGQAVQLWAMGFTGETFVDQVKNTLQELSENSRRTVKLRVLVPDFSKEIEIPGQMGADGKVADAPHFRDHLRRQILDYERSLRFQIERMADARRGSLSVEFRALHMSPSLKLYFINDGDNDVVYEGIYDKIDLHPNPWNTADADRLLDLMGYDSLLTRWSLDDGDHARTVIRRRRELFETFWEAAHKLVSVRVPVPPDIA